jgi:hypothetical protein
MTPQTTHQPRQQVEVIPHGFAGGTTSTPAAAAAPPLAGPDFWRAVAVEVLATLSSWLR